MPLSRHALANLDGARYLAARIDAIPFAVPAARVEVHHHAAGVQEGVSFLDGQTCRPRHLPSSPPNVPSRIAAYNGATSSGRDTTRAPSAARRVLAARTLLRASGAKRNL